MEKVSDYQPEFLEFVLPKGTVPEVLCELDDFADQKFAAQQFIANTFVAFNSSQEAVRKMDDHELEQAREAYREVLEDELPELEQTAQKLMGEAKAAQDKAKTAQELYNATITKIKDLAHVAKVGETVHVFGAHECWKVPIGKQYKYYAICGNLLRLVKVQDIPEWEQKDLLNSMNQNLEEFSKMKIKAVAV
jgi:hypothetical protein